jgi:hypothetical protein
MVSDHCKATLLEKLLVNAVTKKTFIADKPF